MNRIKMVRVKKLKAYVEKNGYCKIALYCGYDRTVAIEAWVKRESIPVYMESKLDKLFKGEASVEVQIN